MNDSIRYAPRNDDDIVRLVEENPLSWVFLRDAAGSYATAVPIRPVLDSGRLSRLVGHVPRASRIAHNLVHASQGLILVMGPHGYISPSWLSDRTQAPTWNYTSAQFTADLRLVEESGFLEDHLRDLTGAMEHGRINAWTVGEMGHRFQSLSARIIPIVATIRRTESRFKLGQNENDQTYGEIIYALAGASKARLMKWMSMFNPNR